MLLLLILTICFLLFVSYYYKNYNYWKKRNIVQVNGYLTEFIFKKRPLALIVKELYDTYSSDLYIGVFLGTNPAVILKDVKDIQAVMGEFQSFHSRGIVFNEEDVLGNNLLFMDNYRQWKLIRQKLSPVFTSLKLKNMFYIFDNCARDFVDSVHDNEDFKNICYKDIYMYNIECITASLFGLNEERKTTDSPFLKMVHDVLEPNLSNNLRFLMSNLFPTIFKIMKIKSFGKYEEFFVGTIKTAFEARKFETGKRFDFIETCLKLKYEGTMRDVTTGYELEPTNEVLAAQAFFFFLAGVDTTATAFQFTLLELAQNQDILYKVHNEIDKVFEECDSKLKPDDIEKLIYLEKVINEVLRMHPPIGFVQRKCTKDIVLPAGNLEIKKDNIVILPIFAMHRNPKYFPNPDMFDPERFDRQNIGNIESCSYIPFGEGNRICLGARFARLQLKCGLAWILRRFTLKYKIFEPIYEPSPFAMRDTTARFELIPRSL